MKIERKLVRKLVRKFARKFARKFGHENFATKRFGKFSQQKIHSNLRRCSGTLLGNERRRPKSEMLGISQPGRALRRFRTTMSAHASKPSNFLCVSLWCQGCFRNLFVKLYRWMGKTEVIMVVFAEDYASNRPRKIFDPKKSTGTLVGDWLSQPVEVPTQVVPVTLAVDAPAEGAVAPAAKKARQHDLEHQEPLQPQPHLQPPVHPPALPASIELAGGIARTDNDVFTDRTRGKEAKAAG